MIFILLFFCNVIYMNFKRKYIKYKLKYLELKNKNQSGGAKNNTKSKSMFMFTDASSVYSKYDKKYNKHDKGYVILGPPGIGKTTFVRNQSGKKKDWIDQDNLFSDLGVKHKLNMKNEKDFKLNYLRADYMSEQTRSLGYRMIGGLFWEFKADAIVLLPLDLHKKYLSKRKDLNLKIVMDIRYYHSEHAKKNKIPVFNNIIDAKNYLEKL